MEHGLTAAERRMILKKVFSIFHEQFTEFCYTQQTPVPINKYLIGLDNLVEKIIPSKILSEVPDYKNFQRTINKPCA